MIDFDAPIEKLFAKLEVTGADGKNEAVGAPQVSDDGRQLSVKVGALKPGDYTVKWAVVCIDTHHTEGSYTFSVANGIVIPQPIFAWPLVASQVLIFGTPAFALMAAPRDVVDGDRWSRSMAVLWRVLALIVLVMSPLRLLSVGAGNGGLDLQRSDSHDAANNARNICRPGMDVAAGDHVAVGSGSLDSLRRGGSRPR